VSWKKTVILAYCILADDIFAKRDLGNPSQASCETIWEHREFFIVGPFLFVYLIFYGNNAEVPVDVLVASIPWCPSDSS